MSAEAPFGCEHAEDMFSSIRDELYVIEALVEQAHNVNQGGRDQNLIDAVLMEAIVRIHDMIPQCGIAMNYFDKPETTEMAKAA